MDERIKAFYKQLKTQRDELRVQIHLGAAELKDDWEEAEKKWQHAEQKFEEVMDDAGETAHEVKEALGVVSEELGAAYKRIKTRLDEAQK